MTTEPNQPEKEPVFIFSMARCGSTLLRYILNTHEDLWCPPEIELINVIRSLWHTFSILYNGDPSCMGTTRLEEKVGIEIRQTINNIMRSFIKGRSKTWCDKSVITIDDISLVRKIFPRAKYIYLYRHCMDYIYSIMEATKFGWPGYFREPFQRYISSNPTSIVDAWANCWCDQTGKMVSFENRGQFKNFRLKYESMVLQPELAIKELFTFIGVPFEDDFLGRVFKKKHQQGPGDIKIQFTGAINSTSVGRGRRLPIAKIGKNTLIRINSLLKELDFETVGEDWNIKENHYRLDVGDRRKTPDIKKRVEEMFEVFNKRMRERDVNFIEKGRQLKILIKDLENAAWLIGYGEPEFNRVDKNEKADTTLFVDATTLLKIVDKKLNIGIALEHGLIHIQGNPNAAYYLSLLLN